MTRTRVVSLAAAMTPAVNDRRNPKATAPVTSATPVDGVSGRESTVVAVEAVVVTAHMVVTGMSSIDHAATRLVAVSRQLSVGLNALIAITCALQRRF